MKGIHIAKKLCEISNWSITNLQLQKLLYIASMLYAKNSHRLIDEDFEAWHYGPVVPEVYDKTRFYGADIIKHIFDDNKYRYYDPKHEKQVDEFLRSTWEQLKNTTTATLVAITHWEEGAWAKNYDPEYKRIIPFQDILQEYKDRDARRRK